MHRDLFCDLRSFPDYDCLALSIVFFGRVQFDSIIALSRPLVVLRLATYPLESFEVGRTKQEIQ